MNGELLILFATFMAVALIVIAVAGVLRRDPALRRMSGATVDTSTPGGMFYKKKQSRLLDMLEPFRKQLTQTDQKQVGVVKTRLVQAGFYDPMAVEVYYTVRLVLAVGLAIAATLLVLFVLPALGANISLFIILQAATIGYYFPALVVRSRIEERQTAFKRGMPDAMDMILVGVEAGLSLPASINHLCEEFADAHPIIAEQFRIVALEFQAGKSRADALASLSRRMDVPEARVFSTMIAQAEQLGTSLSATLRVLAEQMRSDRMLKAEERAAELPVKMAIPLVTCIFPALFSVIMSPLMIRIIRTLSGVVQ
jgi:tight adherence protein C